MRYAALSVAKTVAFLALVGILASCGDAQEAPRSGVTAPLEAATARGGITPPHYEEPVLLRDGDYLPHVVSPEEFDEIWQRGVAAEEADSQKPDFEGVVARIELYSISSADRAPKQCAVEKLVEAETLKVNYLPPGTYANGPQFAGICPDGSTSFVMREFSTRHGSFDVIFDYGEPVILHDASAERVTTQPLDGITAVVISPILPEEGFGRGWAAYATPRGVMVVRASMLPVNEMIKILEGIECSAC